MTDRCYDRLRCHNLSADQAVGRIPSVKPFPCYHQAARFAGEELADAAYFAAQEAIYARAGEIDLSAYRFQLNRVYHVAVLGERPPAVLDEQLTAILTSGEPADLPADVLRALSERRRQATRHGGSWSEGHYRPGRRL